METQIKALAMRKNSQMSKKNGSKWSHEKLDVMMKEESRATLASSENTWVKSGIKEANIHQNRENQKKRLSGEES